MIVLVGRYCVGFRVTIWNGESRPYNAVTHVSRYRHNIYALVNKYWSVQMPQGVDIVERYSEPTAVVFEPFVRSLRVSRQPTAYTTTIILYLRDISHKVVEYLDLTCFVYFVFLVDIYLVDEIP